MTPKLQIQKRFLIKASNYDTIPPLIKNSTCDKNAKICLKDGLVKLVKSTKTGNTYSITSKGWKFLKENKNPMFNIL